MRGEQKQPRIDAQEKHEVDMRRADRLFKLIQILRGAKKPVTAQQLADELETSTRTIYRDIEELLAQHVPIRGEAGVGYVLEAGYDMPPLMLTPDEIEAAVLGAQWVAARGDSGLAHGARDLIAKINTVVPAHLRPLVMDSSLMVPDFSSGLADALDMTRVREWMRQQGKLEIRYRDEAGYDSSRIIWPIGVAYFETVRLIVAWCELRVAFRHFRTDRIQAVQFLQEKFTTPATVLREKWWQEEKTKSY